MCANFKPLTPEQVQALGLPAIPFDYVSEVFPSYELPLLFRSNAGLEWRSVQFGLLPKWAENKDAVKYTYNARNETLLEKQSFQEAFQKHKFGLIPVTEFYEVKYINGRAQRWGVRRKDGKAFYIAALYEIAKIQDEIIRSATMITMDAKDHEMMREFHEPGEIKRSVIVIPHDQRDAWLTHQSTDLSQFVHGFPVNEFECFYHPKPKHPKDSLQMNFFDDIDDVEE